MAASFATVPTARAIRMAADRLNRGDIILLEIHRSGPGASGVGQDGYIAIEWWPDDLAAIRYAVSRGVIVVEAAGNGARDLDAAIYNTPGAGFPASWRNPFNIINPTSGAVVVGAGSPRLARTAGTTARPLRLGSRTTADGRCAGGPRGDDYRVRRPAGRGRPRPVVHGHLQRHVQRFADRGGRPRVRPGHPPRSQPAAADAGGCPVDPAGDGLAAAGRAGPPTYPADRQPAESAADRLSAASGPHPGGRRTHLVGRVRQRSHDRDQLVPGDDPRRGQRYPSRASSHRSGDRHRPGTNGHTPVNRRFLPTPMFSRPTDEDRGQSPAPAPDAIQARGTAGQSEDQGDKGE